MVAAGAAIFVEAIGAMALVEGAAAVDADGAGAAAVEAAGEGDELAAFSGLLQAARAQAKAAAEKITRYFFMFVHHQNVQGRRKFMILLDDLDANRAIGRAF